MTPKQLERFMAKVQVTERCWLWTGAMAGDGYGTVRIDSCQIYVHRASHEHFIGPIPGGHQIDHLCRTHNCVNPAHLEAVTRRENLRRGETIIARQIATTHCPQGHPYSGENLYIDPRGHRQCRECRRESNRRWQLKRAA